VNLLILPNNLNRASFRQRIGIYLSILLAVAVIIGAYKVATATVIAKDGVYYINQAKRLHSDPVSVIKEFPPGYPFLILMAHKLLSSISGNISVYG
jgi:hypothetical protein